MSQTTSNPGRERRRIGPAASVAAFALLAVLPGPATAQDPEPAAADTVRSGPVRVYLDCPGWLCDFDYARREIPYVTWVRERRVADVHLLVTEEDTGGGGNRVTLDFLGRNRFAGRERRLTYASNPAQSEAEEREGLVRTMELGLVGYAADTPTARGLRISYEEGEAGAEAAAQQIDDPWDRWVFDVDLSGEVESESRETSFSLGGGLSVNRTTPEWKIDIGFGGRYDESRFDVGDDSLFVSVRERFGVQSVVVKSLGSHWSVGAQGGVGRNSRVNQELSLRLGPAVEYNLFPYAESSRRQLTVLYALSAERFDYREVTIFGERTELRSTQSVNISLDAQQPWGEVRMSVEGSHYLREFQQNRLTVRGRVELQLVEGLSLDLSGSASRIRDQIYLPAEEASDEEILVGEREFATDFETGIRLGLSYTFGSIYSDVVNPRFESLD